MNDDKLLHVYGQDAWHDDVWIVGNRPALQLLRNTLDNALAKGMDTTEQIDEPGLFVNDGEGYEVRVLFLEGDWDTMAWRRLAVPYTEDCAKETHENALWPWDIKGG